MLQLKFWGVGGQGVVTAAKMLSKAVSLHEDAYAITIPSYGHERRGAPVNTSIIIDTEPVLLNSFVYEPDMVVVFDPTIIDKKVAVAAGIKPTSTLILNTADEAVAQRYRDLGFGTVYYADGTQIAVDYIKRAIPNSSMLGAVAASGIVKIESVEKAIIETFGVKRGESNAAAARKTCEETRKM